jgi:hypothetical protein
MRRLSLACLALAVTVSLGRADSITLNAFNDNTPATITFNDGSGQNTIQTLLTQYNVTYTAGPATPITFNTFCIDLTHFVSVGQTYPVDPRGDLASAFTNGSRMAHVFQTYGLADLTSNPDQAAAVQIALWDLLLPHNPTFFGPDADGTYSGGDPSVFQVDLGSNPEASQIATLTNQYLQASIGAGTTGAWLDAAAAGNDPNRGVSVLRPVPEPASLTLLGIGAVGLIGYGWRRRKPRLVQSSSPRPIH